MEPAGNHRMDMLYARYDYDTLLRQHILEGQLCIFDHATGKGLHGDAPNILLHGFGDNPFACCRLQKTKTGHNRFEKPIF